MNNKLILYDIFSYSCMNCLRSAEYIKKIDSRYKNYGLQTIIIHPPEWEFEKESKNIAAGLKQNNINFPFIADNERKLIEEFDINFWPAQFLMSQGKVVYKHIGEGNYKELEDHIIDVLRIKNLNFKKLFSKEPKFSKHPAVYCGKRKKGIISYLAQRHSREGGNPEFIYIDSHFHGNDKEHLCNMNCLKDSKKHVLTFGMIYAADGWNQEDEYLRSTENNQSLTIVTKGKLINFVAESLTKNPVKLSVQLNNEFIRNLEISKPQLYNLLKLKTEKPQKLTLVTEKNLAIYSFSFQ